MTEKQYDDKAIYRLKIHKDFAGLNNGTCIVNVKDLETVLHLLEIKNTEIEEYKNKYENLKSYNKGTKEALRVSEEMEKYYSIEASELEAEIEKQDKTINRLVEEQEEKEKYTHILEAEIEKKEKIIDLIVMYLLDTGNENIKDIVCDNCPHQECHNYNGVISANCIKRYFENLVKEK